MRFNNNQTFNGPELTIKKITLVEREGYQNQWIRPYEMDVGYDDLNNIENMLDKKRSTGINNIKAIDITNTLPDMLLYSATPTMAANIKNSWSAKRGIFMLEAVQPGSSGYSETIYYIQGYTEHWDVSYGGKIDDNMEFFINTIIAISRTYNPNTKNVHSRVVDNFSVVHNHSDSSVSVTNNNLFTAAQENVVAARPDDVLITMAQKVMFDTNENNITIVPDSSLRLGGVDSDRPTLVKRSATTPAGHMSTTMTGIMQSNSSADVTYRKADIIEQAGSSINLASPNMEDILFIRKLTEQNGFSTTSKFTLSDLQAIDPSLTGDRLVIYKTGQSYSPNSFDRMADDTMSTHAPTEENRVITMTVESLIDYLSGSAITHLLVHATNRNGQPEVHIVDSASIIENLDVNLMLSRIHSKILNELFPVISRKNLQMIDMMVDMDLIGNTMITVSINDGTPETLNVPTAMESVFSPIISDQTSFDNLVKGYQKVADTIITSEMKF